MQHFANCVSVANAAKAEGRTTLLAVLSDEESRQRFTCDYYYRVGIFLRRLAWQNLSMALGEQFKVGAYAQKLSDTVLREARTDFDLLLKQELKDSNNKRDPQASWGESDSKRVTHSASKFGYSSAL